MEKGEEKTTLVRKPLHMLVMFFILSLSLFVFSLSLSLVLSSAMALLFYIISDAAANFLWLLWLASSILFPYLLFWFDFRGTWVEENRNMEKQWKADEFHVLSEEIGNLNTCGRWGESCLVVVKKEIAPIKYMFKHLLNVYLLVDSWYSETVANLFTNTQKM